VGLAADFSAAVDVSGTAELAAVVAALLCCALPGAVLLVMANPLININGLNSLYD
jgi:hypothetical protein